MRFVCFALIALCALALLAPASVDASRVRRSRRSRGSHNDAEPTEPPTASASASAAPATIPATSVPPALPAMPASEVQSVTDPGVLLENLTWVEAEAHLKPDAIIVIPLGAAAKEHGPHLRLKNDFLIAEYLKRRVLESAAVVVAPTINYSFYPAFVEYPGSTSLRAETARDMVVDICRGLSRFGPRRFYILNTGISTLRPLAAAADQLVADGVLMRYSDTRLLMGDTEKKIKQQPGGSHADEIETSMMLYMAPETVDMSRASNDYDAVGQGALTRIKGGPGTYSPTGIWGDATLATRAKGEQVVEALVAGVLRDLEALRHAAPPEPKAPAAR